MQKKIHIIIIAGEPSADMHGATLAQELKTHAPQIEISGIGSERMRKAGVNIFADLSPYAVIGFIEIIKHISIFKNIFELTLQKIKILQPQAVILIDFPGFNLRLAKRIKKDFPQIKVIYYISPQIWAWGKKRIGLIKEVVDKMLVVFEFEQQLYQAKGIDSAFVGHPLLETVKCELKKDVILTKLKSNPQDKIIALLPGSRQEEIKKILPVMLKSAEIFLSKMPDTKFVLLRAANIKKGLIENMLHKYPHLTIAVCDKNSYDALSISFFAWVCSGTATLETAILGIPMLIVYKTSFFTWFISRLLIKLPYIGLVNVVAGEKIVSEFVQYEANPKNIVKCTLGFFLKSKKLQDDFRQKLNMVREKLGKDNANEKAAKVILEVIKESRSLPHCHPDPL